jgi:hypothetical protein
MYIINRKFKLFSIYTGSIFILWNENYHISLVATPIMKYLFSYHKMKINPVLKEKKINILYIFLTKIMIAYFQLEKKSFMLYFFLVCHCIDLLLCPSENGTKRDIKETFL